jgi:hypothetical protein
MNVVVLIEGREAIPVRAIPFLANWRFMSPDIVAHVLGGTGGSNVGLFGDMQSNRIEDGKIQHLKKDDWVQFPLMELQALSEKIKADESSHAVGYSEWRKQSLKVLPAGVFVWKDEYQALHDKNWNSRYKMTYCALRDWNSEGEAIDSDEENETHIQRKLTREELVEDIALKRDLRESLEILNRWREPSYTPFMLPELCAVVMEGFEQATPAEHQTAQSLIDERDELKANIKRWEAKDDSLPSETLIKEKELERLRARLAEVEEKIRDLRGDDLEPKPKIVVPIAFLVDDAWKLKAQNQAREIIKRQKAKDLYPNRIDIADEIANEFRKKGIFGTSGKPLTGETIKRHALKGISSAKAKQLSTAITSGKRGK